MRYFGSPIYNDSAVLNRNASKVTYMTVHQIGILGSFLPLKMF